jgi:hypothetical protein
VPVEYPRQLANSPWHNNPLPAEEPLGVDIYAVEAVGTAAEIEQSLREARDGVDAPSMPEPTLPGDERSAAGLHHPVASSAPSPPSKQKRKSKP